MARPGKTDDPRRSILEAARALVLASGHEAVSLRSVAARAGYSPASLYEYFGGREELLAEVAGGASRTLTAALASASARVRTGPEALVEVGLAYVRFAREHPEDFALLFSSMASRRRSLAEGVPAGSSYAVVQSAVRSAFVASGRRCTRQALEGASYALWACAHGMATLQAGHLRGFDASFDAVDRRTLRALVAGLGLAG